MTHPIDAPQPRRYTVEEYYAFEAVAEEKHEYVDGRVLTMVGEPVDIATADPRQVSAMAGGTYESSTIESNVARELGVRLKGRPCRPHGSNLKVRIPRTGRRRYPDALVICDAPEFDPADVKGHTITNPRLTMEILSPSTEKIDRTEKFDDYWSVPSLQEYVLVSQTEPRIETYVRSPEGGWKFDVAVGLSAIIKLKSIGVELPLAEVYAGVVFPETRRARHWLDRGDGSAASAYNSPIRLSKPMKIAAR